MGEQDQYEFEPTFERALAGLSADSEPFWNKLGRELDWEAMRDPVARLCMKGAQAVAKDIQRGPGSAVVVIQRIGRWVAEGKVTRAELAGVADMLEEPLPAEDGVIAEAAPVLKKRMQKLAVRTAMEGLAQGNLDAALTLAEKAKTLGVSEQSPTVGIGGDVDPFSLAVSADADRMSTGAIELDEALYGGTKRAELTIWGMGAGAGKSMGMNQQVARCCRDGRHAAYATLEVTVEDVVARYIASQTGYPIDVVKNDRAKGVSAESFARARDAYYELRQSRPIGMLRANYFSPGATTPQEIVAWIEEQERSLGIEISLVAIDYMDLLIWGDGTDPDHIQQKKITRFLRDYARKSKKWVTTASQLVKGKGDTADPNKKVRLSGSDLAQGMGKVRETDLLLLVQLNEGQIDILVAKNRTGESNISIGPLPNGYSCGNLIAVPRENKLKLDSRGRIQVAAP